MRVHQLQPRTHEPVFDLPALSLDPPSLMLVEPAPLLESPPETVHVEPDWRGRTARTQYRDSEIYQPLSSLLIGGRVMRAALLIAVFASYNAALGWLGWSAWGSAHATNDQALVIGVALGGLLAGWIVAVIEQRHRLRRRFTFKV